VFESDEQRGKFRFMEVWRGSKVWFMEVRTLFFRMDRGELLSG
jgi:hypothetical protein